MFLSSVKRIYFSYKVKNKPIICGVKRYKYIYYFIAMKYKNSTVIKMTL